MDTLVAILFALGCFFGALIIGVEVIARIIRWIERKQEEHR